MRAGSYQSNERRVEQCTVDNGVDIFCANVDEVGHSSTIEFDEQATESVAEKEENDGGEKESEATFAAQLRDGF